MFLPPAVMMMSFLRPVVEEDARPSSDSSDVSGVQPAALEGLSGRPLLSYHLVVALEDVGAPDGFSPSSALLISQPLKARPTLPKLKQHGLATVAAVEDTVHAQTLEVRTPATCRRLLRG